MGLALRKSTKSAGLFTEDLFAMIAKFREIKVWCMRDLLRLLKRTPVKMVGGMYRKKYKERGQSSSTSE